MSHSVLCTDRAEVEATFRLLEEENRNNPHIVNGMMAPRYLSYDMDAQSVVIEYDVKDWEMNRVGILHGGILSTMLDHAAGITVAAFVGHRRSTCRCTSCAPVSPAIPSARKPGSLPPDRPSCMRRPY